MNHSVLKCMVKLLTHCQNILWRSDILKTVLDEQAGAWKVPRMTARRGNARRKILFYFIAQTKINSICY